MRHNKQVSEHIKQIKADVESSQTEADLIEVIASVKSHPGPLDYNDRQASIIVWALTYLCTCGIMTNYFADGFRSSLTKMIFNGIDGSVYWLPAAITIALVRHLEHRGKRLPVLHRIGRPWIRFSVAGAAVAGILAIFPPAQQAYWFVLEEGTWLASLHGLLQISVNKALLVGIAALLGFRWLSKRKHWRDPVSDRIHQLNVLFNNGLTPVTVDPKEKAKVLLEQFNEFERGNHTRTIDAFYQGHYQGPQHSFDFELFHFHYVVKTRSTYTDNNGKTQTRTTYDHFHRHGLLFNFPYAKSVTLDGDGLPAHKGQKYTSASNEFNRIYRVRTQDQMQAARLLKPATVERLTNLAREYRRPVVEINHHGNACVAIDDQDLLELKRQHGLDAPEAFIAEVGQHAKLNKLDNLLLAIHELMRLSDNNFK